MRKLLLFLFSLCSLGSAQQKAVEQNNQPALTIYNQNFFLSPATFLARLEARINRAEYADRAHRTNSVVDG